MGLDGLADLLPKRQHRTRRNGKLVDADRQERFGQRKIRAELAADADPDAVLVRIVAHHLEEAQHRGMMRVEEAPEVVVLAVARKRVLRQVVRAAGEEVDFFCKPVGDDRRRGRLDHDTDLDRAFEQILRMAICGNASNEDLPRALVVISDMEIDSYYRRPNELDFVDKWRNRFMEAGYDMPQLVLWNVAARQNTYVSSARPSVKFLSGSSASVFRDLIDTLNCANAYEAMVKTLMNPIYNCVITSLGE